MKRLLTKYLESYRGFSKAIWILSFGAFINSFGMMVTTFLALYLSDQLHFSVIQTGNILAAYGAGYLAGGYFGGKLCDKIDPRKILIASLSLTGMGYLILPFAHSFHAILALMFLVGTVESFFRPAYNVTLARCAPQKIRTRAWSLYYILINAGIAVGSVSGGFLAQKHFAYVCWVDGVTSLLAALLYIFFRHSMLFLPTTKISEKTKNHRSPWSHISFLIFCGLTFGTSLVFFQIKSTYPLYLNGFYHLSFKSFGFLMMLNGLLIILFEVPLLKWLERFRNLHVAGVGSLLLCGGFALLPFGTTSAFAILCILISTLGEMLLFPTSIGLVMSMSHEKRQGEFMGLYQTVYSLSYMLAPILGTILYERFSPNVLWYCCGVLGIFSLFGFFNFLNDIKEVSSDVPLSTPPPIS